jgi:hypothetical protein
MKAMSHTLYLVVAAVVILVTALIVIVIFQLGVQPAVGLTEAKSLCLTQATLSCKTYNQMPPNWNIPNVKVTTSSGTETKACSAIEGLSGCTCSNIDTCAGGSTYDKCSEPGAEQMYADCR